MRIKFIDVGKVRTRYLDAGEGEPVILLHGVGMSGDVFLPNIGPLSGSFRVLAPDLCGHGFTDAVDFGGEPPPVVMARHVIDLAKALGLSSYTVGGSSFGALIAALMYFLAPDHVRRLIVIGSGSVFHPGDEQKRTLRAAMANGVTAMADPTLESCRQRMARIVYDAKTVPEEVFPIQLTAFALPDRLSAYQATIGGTIDTMDAPDARVFGRLEKIAAPTLVITGREDVRASWELTTAGVQRMPDARLRIYERCGHMPFMEHPDRFNADVSDFLASTSRLKETVKS
jgi:pimeloyl-ACP methyl ester carboxylesterase